MQPTSVSVIKKHKAGNILKVSQKSAYSSDFKFFNTKCDWMRFCLVGNGVVFTLATGGTDDDLLPARRRVLEINLLFDR